MHASIHPSIHPPIHPGILQSIHPCILQSFHPSFLPSICPSSLPPSLPSFLILFFLLILLCSPPLTKLPSSIKPIANFIASFLTCTSSPTSSGLLHRHSIASSPALWTRTLCQRKCNAECQVKTSGRMPEKNQIECQNRCQEIIRNMPDKASARLSEYKPDTLEYQNICQIEWKMKCR